MKKLLIMFLTFALVASLTACVNAQKEEIADAPVQNNSQTEEKVEEAMSNAPLQEVGAPQLLSENSEKRESILDMETITPQNSETYGLFSESPFLSPKDAPLSTFSIDVDTASYANVRRMLTDGYLPNSDAVRIEEFINYFDYTYTKPKGNAPIALDADFAPCPWNKSHVLARVTLQADDDDAFTARGSNFVFLLDVSGSMSSPDKLPLVKQAMLMLSQNLKATDRVCIVVYAGQSGVVLNGAQGNDTQTIKSALDRLDAGGSTAGGQGIMRAYALAEDYYVKGGNNRVILCTDGDFNVGVSSQAGLEALIEEKRESGVYLSVLGFGTGNIKDNKMETLADKGNGNYAYIDTILEAQKVLVHDINETLYTVAKDVKIQVEFNPKAVKAYRLVGYDNRRLADEDFNDDTKDAGEVGSGHTVTVFYELLLADANKSIKDIDDLVFSDQDIKEDVVATSLPIDWLYVKARYKLPNEYISQRITLMAGKNDFSYNPDDDFKFASAVTAFALLLKNSEYAGNANYDDIIMRALQAKGYDAHGYRAEFIRLVELANTYDQRR